MLKLLLCILCGATIGVLLLELRQQRLNLTYRTDQLHNQIEASQAQLWNQQLQIAIATAPNAIANTVSNENIKLVTPHPTATGKPWFNDAESSAAE